MPKFSYNQRDEFVRHFAFGSISASALDETISWIQKNLNPEDVFDRAELQGWAESEGYVKSGGEGQ